MKKIKVNVCPEKYGDYGDGTMVKSILNGHLAFELEIQTKSQRLTQILTLDEISILQKEIENAITERKRGLTLKLDPEDIKSKAGAKEYLVSFEPSAEECEESNEINMINPKTLISRVVDGVGNKSLVVGTTEECEEIKKDKSFPADYDFDLVKMVNGRFK